MAVLKKIVVRLLIDLVLDGVRYLANDALELDAGKAKALVKAGSADDNPDAVGYAVKTLGRKLRKH